MRSLFVLLTAVLAVVALVPSGANAQSLTSASGSVPGLDLTHLSADGWTEEQPGFWTREVRPGVVQRLAFGAGRVELIPEMQAELDLLVGRISVAPSEKLFAAIDELSATLANLTGFDAASGYETIEKVGPCDPNTVTKYVNANVFVPGTGWRGMLVNASVYWNDPSGLPCNGHAYTRGYYNIYSPSTGTESDFQYEVNDYTFGGNTSTILFHNYTGATYTSCSLDAYAYLNLLNGALVLSQTASANSC
jgi:hypothetical protein